MPPEPPVEDAADDSGALGWSYRDRAAGSAWSDLTRVESGEGWVEHPQDLTVNEGEVAPITLRVRTVEDAVFRWERSFDGGLTWALAASTRSEVEAGVPQLYTLRVAANIGGVAARHDGALYRGVLEYADRTVYSDVARLTVVPARVVVAEHPEDQVVYEAQSVTFSAAHGGTTFPVSTQWQFSTDGGATFNYVPGGATQSSLTIDRVTLAMDGWQYRVRFTNAAGSAWSDAATLAVYPVPPPASISITPTVRFVEQLSRPD